MFGLNPRTRGPPPRVAASHQCFLCRQDKDSKDEAAKAEKELEEIRKVIEESGGKLSNRVLQCDVSEQRADRRLLLWNLVSPERFHVVVLFFSWSFRGRRWTAPPLWPS